MRLASRQKINVLILLAGIAFLLTAPESALADFTGDTVFSEIELSEEGVIAYDTLGDRWVYDFDDEMFVPGDLWPDSRRDESDFADQFRIPPVEERCTEEKTVRPLQGTVLVGYDEYVDDNIRTYGRVTIRGWVKGDVQSYNGRVLVTESGVVDGDIEAPEIILKEGARVEGELIETDPLVELPGDVISYSFSTGGIWVVTSFTIFFLLTGFIALTLMPAKTENFARSIAQYPTRCYLLGLLLTFLMPMVMALVAITIVGVFVVAFVPVIYLAAYTLGIVSFSLFLGKYLFNKFVSAPRTDLLSFIIGLAVLMALWFIVAILMGSADEVANGFGIFFLVVAILVTTWPVCTGAGAAFLTRFGFRDKVVFREKAGGKKDRAPQPAPPPIPKEPPVVGKPVPPRPPAPPANNDISPRPLPPLPSETGRPTRDEKPPSDSSSD